MSGRDFGALLDGQDWRITWHPPPDPPRGTRHGAEAVCVAGGRVVLVSRDGRLWGLPAGRPEVSEDWVDTLRREVREEACAEITRASLLGFTRGVCVRGRQEGSVLVRSHWRAEVRLQPWRPRFEMTHRRLVPADEALQSLTIPSGLGTLYRCMFAEAARAATGEPHSRVCWPELT